MAILDDLSGFEFEDLMEDVFCNLGYENVRQAARTADEGRDIIMEEVIYQKAMENTWLVGANAVTILLFIVGLLVIGGIL